MRRYWSGGGSGRLEDDAGDEAGVGDHGQVRGAGSHGDVRVGLVGDGEQTAGGWHGRPFR